MHPLKLAIAAGPIATALLLTGCGSSHPAALKPPAECSRATSAAQQVTTIATFYNGVSTQMDVVTADDQVAGDSSITGSEASALADIAAAGTGAPSRLARPLAGLGADYQALQTDLSDSGSPAQVSQDAAAVLSDGRQVDDVCG
jgi:hypothetical protein